MFGYLGVRVRHAGTPRQLPRWRLPVSVLLRHIPEVTLLLRGIQGGLGICGATTVWLGLFLAWLAIAWIPWFGWILTLIGATAIVPLLMPVLWSSHAWEDVYLASITPQSWRRTICTTMFVAALPALPALVLTLLLGRVTLYPYALTDFGRDLYQAISPVPASMILATLAVFEVAFAFLLFGGCVLAALETWTDRAINAIQFRSGANKELGLVALAFIALAAVNMPTSVIKGAGGTAIWLIAIVDLVALGITILVATLATFFAWRKLRITLQRLLGASADDFADRAAWRIDR